MQHTIRRRVRERTKRMGSHHNWKKVIEQQIINNLWELDSVFIQEKMRYFEVDPSKFKEWGKYEPVHYQGREPY